MNLPGLPPVRPLSGLPPAHPVLAFTGAGTDSASGLAWLDEAVRRLRPHLVDVSSGVEASPGIKDPDRMRAFLAAAGAAPGTVPPPLGPREG